MPYIEVYVEQDEIDELASEANISDFSTEELIEELGYRNPSSYSGINEQLVYELYNAKTSGNDKEFNRVLEQFFWQSIKKVL